MARIAQTIAVILLLASFTHTRTTCIGQEPKTWIGNYDHGEDSGLIVAESAKQNVYVAYSKLTGKWTPYTFPKDLTVTPITSGGIVAFRTLGMAVKKLVAVDRNGNWQETDLGKPIDLELNSAFLAVDKNIAVYQIAGTSYAFSGISGKWDAITDHEKPKVAPDMAMIVGSNRITVFSAQTSKWSESPELATTK